MILTGPFRNEVRIDFELAGWIVGFVLCRESVLRLSFVVSYLEPAPILMP